MDFRNFITRHYLKILWLALLTAGAILFLWGIGHEDLWYDECYSAAMIRHSFIDICRITSGDSHPPLYYILLKAFSMVFGNSVISLRLFSVLGALLLVSLGAGPIRRAADNFTALIFMFITIITPAIFSYAQEARMYTWTAFFVCGSAVYGYLAVNGSKKPDWVWFGVLSIGAAYTHYYGLVAVGAVCFLVFIFILIKHREKMLPFILTVICMVCAYLPWTFLLYSQLKRIGGNFWIPKITGGVLLQTLVYPFNHKFTYEYKMLLPVLAISALIILYGVYTAFKKNSKEKPFILFILSIYILTLAGSIIISKLMRPLLIPRYILVVVSMFITGIAYGIKQLENKKLIALGLVISLVLAAPQLMQIRNSRYNGDVREAVGYLTDNITNEDIFIHMDGNTYGVFCYYLPDNKQFLYQQPGAVAYSNYDAFAPNGYYGTDLAGFLKGHKYVYIVKRLSSYWSAAPNYDKLFKAGNFKESGEIKEFTRKEAWFNFSIQKVTVPLN